MPKDEKVPTSSIVMKAIDAQTFNEMQTFVKDLEGRPTERLLHDLPELVRVSESKSSLVAYVISAKYRHGDEVERRMILSALESMHDSLPDGEDRDRVSGIIERVMRSS